MTYEEAKKQIRKLKSLSKPTAEAVDISIEALEKQIPTKPTIEFLPNGDFYWYCPICNEVVRSHIADTPIVNEYNHNYCGGCGRAIDWSKV